MKKTLLIVIMSLFAAICCAFALSACGGNSNNNLPSGNTGDTQGGGETHVHSYGSWIAEIPATCSKAGTKGHYECSGCHKYFDKDKIEIPSLNIPVNPSAHSYGSWVKEVPATCTNTGTKGYKQCIYCQNKFDDSGDKIDDLTIDVNPDAHKLGEWTEEVPATCSATGIKGHYQCEYCQNKFDANGEKISNLTIDINPDAHDFESGDKCSICNVDLNYTRGLKLTDKGSYYSVDGIGDAVETDIVIPCAYMGKPITAIKYEAFENCTSLESITIPDSVTSIGADAFRGCTSLESITIPNSVTSIHSGAFQFCTSLTGVYITDLAAWCNIEFYYIYSKSSNNPLYYAHNLYLDNNLVTNITADMLQGVEEIKDDAFDSCTSLTSITIPDSVTSIGVMAFYNCTNLESVNFGDNSKLISIGKDVFNGCTNLESVNFGDNSKLISIGDSAFKDCTSLTGVYITDLAAWCNIEFGSYYANPLSYAENLYLNNKLVTEITADMLEDVTEIKNYAFTNCTSLTSIFIGKGVTSIGSRAFYNCTSLTRITLPFVGNGSDQTFFGYIFGASSYSDNSKYVPQSLKTVVITDGDSIGNYAFYGCANLTSITIGKGVTSIGYGAFYNCTSLESITIPDSVTSISGAFSGAFYNCTSLTGVYITDIAAWCNIEFSSGDYANPLYYAHNLYLNDTLVTEITADMLQGVTKIKNYAFYGCTNLTSITIPDSVTSIGYSAFYNCTSLTGVYLTDIAAWCNITFSSSDANPLFYAANLYLNSNLVTEITADMLEDVTEIKNYAFYGCTSLTSITIPDSVTSIGRSAFEGCFSLAEVINLSELNIQKGKEAYGYVAWYAVEVISSNDESKIKTQNGYIFYEDGETVYLLGYTGKSTELQLPDNFNGKNYEIYRYAFNKNDKITKVTIPDSVTSIGNYAFNGCTATINWGSNPTIKEIGRSAFYGYKGTSITIPDSVTSIGYEAFYNCTSLTSITIPNSVTSIGSYAFQNCTNLESVNFGDNSKLTSIGNYTFKGCTATINWGSNPTIYEIGGYAFYGYKGTSITIPDSVISIGDSAFEDCTNLESVNFGDNSKLTSISDRAFWHCTSLTSVYITDIATWCNITFGGGNAANPLDYAHKLYLNNELVTEITADMLQGVTEIKDYAFYNCTSLTSVTIPDSVTYIGGAAFKYCENLTSITIGNGVTFIGVAAFMGCKSLTSIIIPNGITSIGRSAFDGCTRLTSVKFENTTSWKVSKSSGMSNATNVTVTNPTKNAELLTDTYCYYYWKRG